MKNAIGTFLAAIVLFASTMEAKELSPIQATVRLTDLTPDMVKELMAGLYPDIAIECNEGNALPVKLLYNFHFLSMKFEPNLTIKVEKPFYLRLAGSKVYMSTDLVYWENAKNILDGGIDMNIGISPDKSHVLIETTLLP